MHKELSLLKIDDVHIAKVLSFVNECRSCRVPDMFVNYYKTRETGLNLRNRSSLDIPWARTDMGLSRCDIKGVRLWNQHLQITNQLLYKRASTSNSPTLSFGPIINSKRHWRINNYHDCRRMYQVKYDASLRTVLSNFRCEVLLPITHSKIEFSFGCQPDEPLASLVTTKRIINVYGCCYVTHLFCPSLLVFCWE